MMRKVLSMLVLLAALALLLAPAAAQDQIEVEMWQIFSDQRLDFLNDRVAAFQEAYPNITVNVRTFGSYEELIQQYELAFESGEQPEIAQLFEVGTQFARDSGYFASVADLVAGREEILGQAVNFDDIVPVVSGYYTVDGVFTSMPWNTSTPIMYANMDMLVEAGVIDSVDAVDQLPATWQELEAACAAVLENTAASNCMTWPNHGWFYEQWLAQQNADLVNNGNGRDARASEVLLTSDASLNTVAWWQNMYDNGYYLYTGVQRDWGGTEQALHGGQVAFIITSSASARGIQDTAAETGYTVRTARMPYDGEIGWTGNIIGGATLWVTAGLDQAVTDATLAWLLFMTNTESAACWHTASGYIPLRLSAIEVLENPSADVNSVWDGSACVPGEGNWFEANPNFFTASDQLGSSTVTTATQGALFGTFIPTRDIVTQAIEEIMLQGLDPVARMEEAKAAADDLLATYNEDFAQ